VKVGELYYLTYVNPGEVHHLAHVSNAKGTVADAARVMTLTPLTTVLFVIAIEVLLALFVILTPYNLLSEALTWGWGQKPYHAHSLWLCNGRSHRRWYPKSSSKIPCLKSLICLC